MKLNHLKFLTLVPLFVLLTACSSNSYVTPKVNNAASISNNSTSNGILSPNWENFRVESIDGATINYYKQELIGGLKNTTTRIKPGKRKLLVSVEFNRTFGGSGPFQSFHDIEFTAQPNTNYQLHGEIAGSVVKTWVVNKGTKKRVSAVSTGSYKSQPTPTYIPIIIPPS